MRVRLAIRRSEDLDPLRIWWSIDISDNLTVADLLVRVGEQVPLHSGGADYAAFLEGAELLAFQRVGDILQPNEELEIRPLKESEIRARRAWDDNEGDHNRRSPFTKAGTKRRRQDSDDDNDDAGTTKNTPRSIQEPATKRRREEGRDDGLRRDLLWNTGLRRPSHSTPILKSTQQSKSTLGMPRAALSGSASKAKHRVPVESSSDDSSEEESGPAIKKRAKAPNAGNKHTAQDMPSESDSDSESESDLTTSSNSGPDSGSAISSVDSDSELGSDSDSELGSGSGSELDSDSGSENDSDSDDSDGNNAGPMTGSDRGSESDSDSDSESDSDSDSDSDGPAVAAQPARTAQASTTNKPTNQPRNQARKTSQKSKPSTAPQALPSDSDSDSDSTSDSDSDEPQASAKAKTIARPTPTIKKPVTLENATPRNAEGLTKTQLRNRRRRLAQKNNQYDTGQAASTTANQSVSTTAAPTHPPVEDIIGDDDWASRITYRAVECAEGDADLGQPPFPFVKTHTQWKGLAQKHQEEGPEEYSSRPFDRYSEDWRGGSSRTLGHDRDDARAEDNIVLPYDEADVEIDGLEVRLSDAEFEGLNPLKLGQAVEGTIIAWKEILLSAAGRPTSSTMKAYVLSSAVGGEELDVRLARWCRPPRNVGFQGMKGLVLDEDEDEDDGIRMVGFFDIGEVKYVAGPLGDMDTVKDMDKEVDELVKDMVKGVETGDEYIGDTTDLLQAEVYELEKGEGIADEPAKTPLGPPDGFITPPEGQ